MLTTETCVLLSSKDKIQYLLNAIILYRGNCYMVLVWTKNYGSAQALVKRHFDVTNLFYTKNRTNLV